MKNSIPNAAKISPTDFVIFGGGGDLSIRKIIPALFWRFVDKQIDSQSNIIICLHKKTELETILNLIKPHTFNSIYLSKTCLLYTSPSPRDNRTSRMPSSA